MCDESDSHTRVHRSLSGFCCGSTQAAPQVFFFPCVLRPFVATVTVVSTTVRPRPSSQVTRGPTALRGLSSMIRTVSTPSLLLTA